MGVNLYPYTNFHELNLDWVLQTVKDLATQWASTEQDWTELKNYIQNYFNTLDLTEEVSNKINELIENGTIPNLIETYVKDSVQPNPKYAANKAEMTDTKSLYVNGEDSHLYSYVNGSWLDTGITYGGDISQSFIWGQLVQGTATLSSLTSGLSGSVTFSTNARLSTKTGAVISAMAGNTYNFSAANNNMYYICYNSTTDALDTISHNNTAALLSNEETPLFGLYQGHLVHGLMELNHISPIYPQENIQYMTVLHNPPSLRADPTTKNTVVTWYDFVGIDTKGAQYRVEDRTDTVYTPAGLNYICLNLETLETESIYYSAYYKLNTRYAVFALSYNNIIVPVTNMYIKGTILLSPAVFVRLVGSSIKISCSQEARATIDGTTVNISTWTLTVNNIVPQRLYYICVNDQGFAVYENNKRFANETVIATSYNYQIRARSKYVIPNMLPITQWTQRAGVWSTINSKRFGYPVVFNSGISQNNTNRKQFENWIQFRNGNPGFSFYRDNFIWYNPITYSTNTTNIDGKDVLMIGDSITNRGWLQTYIKENHNVTFSGTKQCQYANYMCEGYPGVNSSWMVGSESPFYNPNTQAFDFHYYATLYDIEPDYVTIEFGLNESYYGTTYANNIQTMINSIKAHNSNIVIYVLTPFRRYIGSHDNTYASDPKRYLYNQSNICACEALTNCILIPTHLILNDEYDYVYTDIPYGYGDLTVKGCSDPIHPSQTVGFKKLANEIANWLGWVPE